MTADDLPTELVAASAAAVGGAAYWLAGMSGWQEIQSLIGTGEPISIALGTAAVGAGAVVATLSMEDQ